MNTPTLAQIARLRLLVGFLGEQSQFNWWPSSFFTQSSRAFLAPIFSKTALIAQYQGVKEAASRVHDERIGGLMHPALDAPARFDEVKMAVEEMIADPIAPFGEQDGNLCFFSEKLNTIEQERAQIPLRTIETRRIVNEALRETFSPLPSTHLQGILVVQTGLKSQTGGGTPTALAGERNVVQTVIEFVAAQDYDTARTRLVDESRPRSVQHMIYLLGRTVPEMDHLVADIYRCQEIVRRYRNEPEFIFRGDTTAVGSLDHDVHDASKKYLSGVAERVFDRYNEAPVRAETALAEKFLRVGNLTAVTSSIDPLGLVQVSGGRPSINNDYKALVSIRDYIDRMGTVEGKRLTEHFTGAPFGWSQDTLRYLVASMLVAGEIKLKVSGREITVNGQQAIDALKTNNSFRSVGVALREERPSNEVLARAADRLTDLIGDQIIPLEDEISKAATKHFPQFQHQFAPLAEKLASLDLPGDERLRDLNRELADVLFTDASDAPQRLGGEESVLYDNLQWASEVKRALENGLEQTVRQLQQHRSSIEALPDSGIPAQLKTELAEELTLLHERLTQADFYQYAADFNTLLRSLQGRVRHTAMQMEEAQQQRLLEAEQDLKRVPEWADLTQEEQNSVLGNLEALTVSVSHDLQGVKTLLNQEYVIHARLSELKDRLARQGQERRRQRLEEEKAKAKQEGKTKLSRSLVIPPSITDTSQLDALIQELQALRRELALYSDIEVRIRLQG